MAEGKSGVIMRNIIVS